MQHWTKLASACAATILTTIITTGVATAAVQERPGPPRGGPLAMADADKNGEITRAEWLKEATDRFQALDANKDGKIVWSELPRPHFDGGRGPRGHDGRGGRGGPDGGRGGPDGGRRWDRTPPPPAATPTPGN